MNNREETDIIRLLPDHLANQIAAGEVVQRPASAVKELLENSIDSGASEIKLIIKDAGKELIQVVDNGSGMGAHDARMSFERHATSKIRSVDDLFSIKTMGFRGEALASLAAVAQIELKTRKAEDELGTYIHIEASEVKAQEPTGCPVGTSISIKNLFYNVPARRKFLKSNTSELKHILDEFNRVAMAYPQIAFRLYHNNVEQFHLSKGNLKTRIIELLGPKVEKNLLNVDEDTGLLYIHGFIGKPEAAAKTRGNQFFFINGRFIRSAYLHHAVMTAFEGLIGKDAFPFYVLFLEMDPSRVDVNVHPTKQEVKFDDDKLMYAYIQSTVKHALARFNVSPSLDFSLNTEIQNLDAVRLPTSSRSLDEVKSGYLYHTFQSSGKAHLVDRSNGMKEWKAQKEHFFPALPSLADVLNESKVDEAPVQKTLLAEESTEPSKQAVLQWREYLVTTMKSGILLLHQKRAMERIFYERFKNYVLSDKAVSQRLLFPAAIQLSLSDAVMLEELLPDLRKLGYDINPLGGQTFSINGVPPDIVMGQEQAILEGILEQMKHEASALSDQRQESLLKSLAKRMSQPGILHSDAAQTLIDELFACNQPQYAPDGAKVFLILPKEALEGML